MFKYQSGQIVRRSPQKPFNSICQPKVIHYTHMVRKLNFGECNCQKDIDLIRGEYQNKLISKDNQIQALVNRIVIKEKQIETLQEQVKMWQIKWNGKLNQIGNIKENQINLQNIFEFNSYTPNKNSLVDINNVNVNKVLRDITNFEMNSHHILNENHYYNCEIQQKKGINFNKNNNENEYDESHEQQQQQKQLQQQQQQWQKLNNISLNSTYISQFNIPFKNNNNTYPANHQKSLQQLPTFTQFLSPQTKKSLNFPSSSCHSNNKSSSAIQQQINSCFDKTSIIMNEIQNLMKKKNKYEFYNTFETANNHYNIENSIIEQLQNDVDDKDENNIADTKDMLIEDTFVINNHYNNHQYNEPQSIIDQPYVQDNSLYLTNYESVQNFNSYQYNSADNNEHIYYEKILNDTISLKHTIIQMKQQSVKQMSQMEKYYQDKLKEVLKQLERQKNINMIMKRHSCVQREFDNVQDDGENV